MYGSWPTKQKHLEVSHIVEFDRKWHRTENELNIYAQYFFYVKADSFRFLVIAHVSTLSLGRYKPYLIPLPISAITTAALFGAMSVKRGPSAHPWSTGFLGRKVFLIFCPALTYTAFVTAPLSRINF